jgi:hypothetical protein
MNKQASEHPGIEILSLYSAGDLPFLLRFQTGRHVKDCAACEQQVVSFRAVKTELRREAHGEILTGFEAIADWHALESDMLGNIRVGVAAGHCIQNVGRGRRIGSRLAWAAGMTALFAAGWMARMPAEDNRRIISALRQVVGLERTPFNGTVVKSTPDGIAVRAQGATLTILHPQSAVVSMSGPASVTARYVDDDTGQVTITNVYGQ